MNRMWQQPMNGSEDRTTTAIMCDVVPSPPSRPALLHWERTGTRDTKQKKKVTTLQSLLPQLFSLLLLLLDTPHSNRNNKTKKKKTIENLVSIDHTKNTAVLTRDHRQSEVEVSEPDAKRTTCLVWIWMWIQNERAVYFLSFSILL